MERSKLPFGTRFCPHSGDIKRRNKLVRKEIVFTGAIYGMLVVKTRQSARIYPPDVVKKVEGLSGCRWDLFLGKTMLLKTEMLRQG
jgi:hypothetical protein